MTFWEIFEMSKRRHKKDVSFEVFLRGLWDVSLNGDLWDVSLNEDLIEIYQKHLMAAGKKTEDV